MRPLIAALASAASCAAWADEPSPWYLGASQSFTHDSNVYRSPARISDSYSSTGLQGGFDQPIGRQRVYGSANVNYNKYREQDTLDNTSYGLNAGWDWATIEKLSGSLNASANQSLASFNGNAGRPSNDRNLLRVEQVSASARYGGDSTLSLNGNYGHSRVDYSSDDFLSSDSSADTASIGLDYRVGPSLRLGTALRFSRTVSPHAVQVVGSTDQRDFTSNTTNGRNLDLLADWRYSVQTGVSARLSWTNQSNSDIPGRDFSGLTGSLSGTYAPTGKLSFTASLSRDAGAYGSYFNVVSAPGAEPSVGLIENSQTTDSVSLTGQYAATAKIAVNAGYQYRRAKIVSTSGTTNNNTTNNDSTDNYHSRSLGVSYAITRSVQLGCNLARETRSVSGQAAYAYSANTTSCSAQVTLR